VNRSGLELAVAFPGRQARFATSLRAIPYRPECPLMLEAASPLYPSVEYAFGILEFLHCTAVIRPSW
jgi:hypothetical protein